MITVDVFPGRDPSPRRLGTDVVDAPTGVSFRAALHPLELAGRVVASRYELRGSARAEGARPPHSRLRQLFASGQLSGHASETAGGLAASLAGRLTLEIILAGRGSGRTHVLLLEGWASTYCLQWWLWNATKQLRFIADARIAPGRPLCFRA